MRSYFLVQGSRAKADNLGCEQRIDCSGWADFFLFCFAVRKSLHHTYCNLFSVGDPFRVLENTMPPGRCVNLQHAGIPKRIQGLGFTAGWLRRVMLHTSLPSEDFYRKLFCGKTTSYNWGMSSLIEAQTPPNDLVQHLELCQNLCTSFYKPEPVLKPG